MAGYTLADDGEPTVTTTVTTTTSTASEERTRSNAPSKSYGLYVGENLTKSGDPLLAGSGEEVSGHWLEAVPAETHPPDATIKVGVTPDASIPGELIEIPQVRHTHKYLTMNYSDFEGFPAPLTNGGLNEMGVAIRDIWSPSRTELIDMTPTPQRGPQYSDLARVALERADTAREAVRIIGSLIDRYGYSTYGGNSHLIADDKEGWVVIQPAGGKGLWAAERLGPNEVRVSYPGYIGDMPTDYQQNPNFMGSDNLFSFAQKQDWHEPGDQFNFHEVYGDQGLGMRSGAKYLSVAQLEQELHEMAPEVTVDDMMDKIGDRRFVDDESGYGQVVRLRDDLPNPGLATLWVAPTGSITAPFIPWTMATTDVPPEYGQHRYLAKDSASTFLDPDFQEQEATEFAGRTFKRLMYHTCAHPGAFLPEVATALEAFEAQELRAQPRVEDTAAALYRAGEAGYARRYLTEYSHRRAEDGLELGNALLGSIEARAKLQFGIDEPDGDQINAGPDEETVNCLVGADPDRPREDQ
ncbi:MAG TPA: C69 family dipeptidase [Nocardioidaceae bacterium]|nr:C69 family dipeptidase [Nocardioidaceae bacterium]